MFSLVDSWTFCWQTAIVVPAGPQPVRYSNKSLTYRTLTNIPPLLFPCLLFPVNPAAGSLETGRHLGFLSSTWQAQWERWSVTEEDTKPWTSSPHRHTCIHTLTYQHTYVYTRKRTLTHTEVKENVRVVKECPFVAEHAHSTKQGSGFDPWPAAQMPQAISK